MYTTACPSCGAQVSFRSAAAVVAVCGYCRSTLLREGEAVKDIGKMSAVIEDYSPIQITTSGSFGGRNFGVVGRIQLRYDAGFWNEWYLLFDDGAGGWLSDASGQYVLTLDGGSAADAPSFEALRPGVSFAWEGKAFQAADVRSARCTGGEGELPFAVGEGWEAKAADFRYQQSFLTLDYSDGTPPRLYHGRAVTLETLKCQLLRSSDQIEANAGRLRGSIASLACPSCGAAIEYAAGVTDTLVCPACHTRSEVSAGQATALEAAKRVAARKTTLDLGEVGKFDGKDYRLIGLTRCREVGESETWTEYLLYHAQAGFLWLVESVSGWERVEVLNEWPEARSGSGVALAGAAYTKLYDYGSEVIYAAGAFNWQVKVGDRTRITDYKRGQNKLSVETSDSEMLWTRSQPVSAETLTAAFGHPVAAPVDGGAEDAPAVAGRGQLRGIAKAFTWLLLIPNLPIALSGGVANWLIVGVALLMLWMPAWADTGVAED